MRRTWWSFLLAVVAGCAASVIVPDAGAEPPDAGATPDAGPCTECDGGCFDLQTSYDNCGACGNACRRNENCYRGRCDCYYQDLHNVCTAPGNPCLVGTYYCFRSSECFGFQPAPDDTSCGPNAVCKDGGCTFCEGATPCYAPDGPKPCHEHVIDCGTDQCVDVGTDRSDGGACGDGKVCAAGACLPLRDCKAILATLPGFTTDGGLFVVDPDGPGGGESLRVICDQMWDDGGWTLWESPDMNTLPANADMPRCGPGVTSSCYAGSYAGRGDLTGLFYVEADGVTVHQIFPTALPGYEVRPGHVFDGGACVDGGVMTCERPIACVYSQLSTGDCCTSPAMQNFCL